MVNRNEHFIPSLDGLRAVAVVLVCLAHLTWNQHYLGQNGQYLKVGSMGVRIFFVLSGFLITGILLREIERTSSVSLRRFYFRRTMRILPAFYAFVAVVVMANAAHWIHFYNGSAMPSLTYTADYFVPGKRAFGHTWSLAVEEQFYLVWPAALLLLGPRRGMWLAGATLFVCPLMRVISYSLVDPQLGVVSQFQPLEFRLDTQADALAMGCLLAGLRTRLHGYRWYRRFLSSRIFVLVPLLGLLIFEVGQPRLSSVAYLLVGDTVINLAITLSLDWCLLFPSGRIGRVLNAAPVAAVGMISYSIYLWQEPFLFVSRSSWWQRPPASIGLMLLAATASYFFIERPCLRLRARWEPRLFHAPSSVPHRAGNLATSSARGNGSPNPSRLNNARWQT
jgi:peptidoglycan/LPS O-acetylase OafA/YrhL